MPLPPNNKQNTHTQKPQNKTNQKTSQEKNSPKPQNNQLSKEVEIIYNSGCSI